MKIAVFCYSDRGAALALRLPALLPEDAVSLHSIRKYAERYGLVPHDSVRRDMGELFASHDALIFISACGIAVREIAPHLRDKTTDPAVLVMDDQGCFVIPILSGHIGGANELAEKLAALLGAQAVITTATDRSGRFACDSWAVKNNCAISSLAAAKQFSAAILTGDLPVCSEWELPEALPNGLKAGAEGEIGLYIGIRVREPFSLTLRLIPRLVTLGIGCRKGTAPEAIREAVRAALAQENIDPLAVCELASIDLKQSEEGLLTFAQEENLPLRFYSAAELEKAETPGGFTESDFVRQTVGVGNVCERAAVLGGGRLIVRKTALSGVTVAAAVKEGRFVF